MVSWFCFPIDMVFSWSLLHVGIAIKEPSVPLRSLSAFCSSSINCASSSSILNAEY